ncbi:MAG: DUF2255 family protein [Anaerolineales bacterium]
MAEWTKDELNKIGGSEELEIAALRQDGSLHKPVTIWVVRVDDDLYIRSYRGRGGAWYQGALEVHKGRIWAGGVEKDVAFLDVDDPELNDRIDAAYQTKYEHDPEYVPPMVTDEVRMTTLKLVPRFE